MGESTTCGFDVKQACSYLIISLFLVGCKQSTGLLGDAKTSIEKIGRGGVDSGHGASSEVSSKVDDKSGKTSDEGEGVPGYLVDLSLVEIARSGDMLNLVASTGTTKSSQHPLASLSAYVWTVERGVFLGQSGDSWAGLTGAAVLNQQVAVDSLGGFQFSLNARGQVVILVIESKPDISALEVRPRRSEKYNTYYLDFDADAGLRLLPSSPNVLLLLAEGSCSGCSLRDAWLAGETFDRVRLSDADLTGANFTGASLVNADFTASNLSQANFTDANMQEARLRNAKAIGAKFVRANLRDANLDGADLSGADTTGADLSNADITSETKLP